MDAPRPQPSDSEKMEIETHQVVIVGGGPVGLFLGLALAKQGTEVLVLEAAADIVPSPRALMLVTEHLRESQNSQGQSPQLTRALGFSIGTIPSYSVNLPKLAS